MTARTYTVSCTIGPLDDSEVDALADILWDNGAGTITFRPLPEREPSDARADASASAGLGGSRSESVPYRMSDRDALRAADAHDMQRDLKW